jgi:hypothetical protein
LQHAEIVRASTGREAIELFLREGYETAAGAGSRASTRKDSTS